MLGEVETRVRGEGELHLRTPELVYKELFNELDFWIYRLK